MLTTSESQAKPRSAAANPETVARLRRIIGVSLVVLAASAWLLSPGLRAELSDIVRMIGGGRVEALGARLEFYGLWGPLISLAVMVLQGIVAPLPAFVVTFANGLAFGTWMGRAISLAGHVLASTVCFALARKLGRGPVERLIYEEGIGGSRSLAGSLGGASRLLLPAHAGTQFRRGVLRGGPHDDLLPALHRRHDAGRHSRDAGLRLPGTRGAPARSAGHVDSVRRCTLWHRPPCWRSVEELGATPHDSSSLDVERSQSSSRARLTSSDFSEAAMK